VVVLSVAKVDSFAGSVVSASGVVVSAIVVGDGSAVAEIRRLYKI